MEPAVRLINRLDGRRFLELLNAVAEKLLATRHASFTAEELNMWCEAIGASDQSLGQIVAWCEKQIQDIVANCTSINQATVERRLEGRGLSAVVVRSFSALAVFFQKLRKQTEAFASCGGLHVRGVTFAEGVISSSSNCSAVRRPIDTVMLKCWDGQRDVDVALAVGYDELRLMYESFENVRKSLDSFGC